MKFRINKMKYIIKKGLALVLSVVLMGGMIPAVPVSADNSTMAPTGEGSGAYIDISNADTVDYLNSMYSKSLNSEQFEKSKERIVALSEFMYTMDSSINKIDPDDFEKHQKNTIKWHPSQSDIDNGRDLYLLEWVNGYYTSNPGDGYEILGRIVYLAKDNNIYYTPEVNIDSYARKLYSLGEYEQWDQGRKNQALFAMPEDCVQIIGILMCNESGGGNNNNTWWMDSLTVSRITSDKRDDVSGLFTNENGFTECNYQNGQLIALASSHDINQRYLGADDKDQEWLYLLQTPVAYSTTGGDYYAQIVTAGSTDLSDKELTLEIGYTSAGGDKKIYSQAISDADMEKTYPKLISTKGFDQDIGLVEGSDDISSAIRHFQKIWCWIHPINLDGSSKEVDYKILTNERMANEIAVELKQDYSEDDLDSLIRHLGNFHDFRWENAYLTEMNTTAFTYFGNFADTVKMKDAYLGGSVSTDVKLNISDHVASVDSIKFSAKSGEIQDIRIYKANRNQTTRTKMNGGLSIERVFADASDSECLAYLDKLIGPDGNPVPVHLTGTTVTCTPESANDSVNRRLIVNNRKKMNFYDVNDNLGVLISFADVLEAGIETFAADYAHYFKHPRASYYDWQDRLYSTNHIKNYLFEYLDEKGGYIDQLTALEILNLMESYFKESLTLTVRYIDSFGAVREVQVPIVTAYMMQLFSDNNGRLAGDRFETITGVFQQGQDIPVRIPVSQYDQLLSVNLSFGSSPSGLENIKSNKHYYIPSDRPVTQSGYEKLYSQDLWLSWNTDDPESNTQWLKKELAVAQLPKYETFKDGAMLPTDDTIAVRYIRIYEHVNKDNFKSVYSRNTRVSNFSTNLNSSYYFAASNRNGYSLANGQEINLSVAEGTLLKGTVDHSELDLKNIYLVEINGQKISSEYPVPKDINVTFAYTTTGGEQVKVTDKKLSELARSFNGYTSTKGMPAYPTMDEVQLEFDLQKNSVKYLLELDNVSSFDYISLGLPDGVTIGWQVNSIAIYSLTELSSRYSKTAGFYDFNDFYPLFRDFEGDMVALNNKPAALQPGQESKTFYFSKVLEDGTIESPDTDITYEDEYLTVPPTSMSFQETLKNLGLAITKYTYTVDVDVANVLDAGSSNYFYFQLVFENGTSGVVLANQQLAADSFRQGYTESFTIHTTQNYGNVTGIRVICDTSSSESNAFDKLNINKITVSLPSNGGAKSWIMDKVGWIDINYQDEGAATTVAGDKESSGFPNSMVVKEFARTRTASTARLLFNISTAASSPAFSEGVNSAYEVALTYVDSAGYTQTYNFNLKNAIFNYIENTSWTNLFRPNMSDYFTLSLNDVAAVKSMSIYRADGQNDWVIKDISISQFSDLGDVYMDTTGEFKRYVENETLITTSVNAEQTISRNGNATFAFSDHSISVNTNGTNPEGWTTTITRLPATTQETLNFYVYPGSSAARTFAFDKNNPLPVKGRVEYTFKDNGATIGSESFTFTETTDINGVTALKASGIKVNGMNQLKALYLLSETMDNPIISGVQVERIRGNTVVERLYFDYNNETLAAGRTYSATAKADTSASRTKQTLALQVSNGQNQIFGTNSDVAVALLYTNENDASSKQKTVYSSPYVFFTDVGITSLSDTSILEIPFEETGVDQVVGFSIVSNGADISFENALIYNYLTKPTGEAVLIDSCPIAEKISTSTVAKQYMEKANTSVTPVTLTFTTSADSQYQGAGSSGRLPLTINYKNTAGKDASVSYDNLLNLLPANTVPAAGSTISVNVQLTNLESLTSAFISAMDDDWHLYKVSATINQIANAMQIPHNTEAFVDGWITSTKPATAIFGENTQSKIVNFSVTGLTVTSGNVETATSGNVLKIQAVPGEKVSFIPTVTVEGTPDTNIVWDTSQYADYMVDGGSAGLDFTVPVNYNGVSSVGQAFTFACYCSFDTDKTVTVTIEVVEPEQQTPEATPEPEAPETEEVVVSGTMTPNTAGVESAEFKLRDGDHFTHYVAKGSADITWTLAATSSIEGHNVVFTPATLTVGATTGVYTSAMVCQDADGNQVFASTIEIIVVDTNAGMTLAVTGNGLTAAPSTATFANDNGYYEFEIPADSQTYTFTAAPLTAGNTVAIKDKNGTVIGTSVNIASDSSADKLLKEFVVEYTETSSGKKFAVNVRIKTQKAIAYPVNSVLMAGSTELANLNINTPNSTSPARFTVSSNGTPYSLAFNPITGSDYAVKSITLDTNVVSASVSGNTITFSTTDADAVGTMLLSGKVVCQHNDSKTETVNYFKVEKTAPAN